MSYILDAIKKSEQARGSRKTRALFEEPVGVAPIPSSKPKSSRRWPYIVVFTLLLNAGFFVLWLHPWQWGGTNPSSSSISGGHSSETSRQAAPVIPPSPMTQSQVKQETTQKQPAEKQNPAPNPPAPDALTAVSPAPPVSGAQTHKTVQDQIVENKIPLKDQEATQSLKTEPAQPPPTTPGVSRKDEVAAKKPDGPKLPQNPKAPVTKKDLKTAKLEPAPKSQTVRVEQPQRPAAGSGIISDIEPLAELGASSGKPAAPGEQRWHELAPQIRDALPNLSVSMLIFSKKSADRWININGSKRREGEEISAGLKVEEITPEGAIFSYQGHRFYKGVVGN
jgi:hypothetical protein